MPTLIQLLGWSGSILIVVAYAFKRSWSVPAIAVMNLVGCLFLGISLSTKSAYEGVALQVVWGIISLKDLVAARGRSSLSPGD